MSRLIVAVAVITALCTFIATPRPTRPHVLPLPRFDLQKQKQTEEEEQMRAQRVVDGSLPNSVRAVGEQVRRMGVAIHDRKNIGREQLKRLRKDVRKLIDHSRAEELLNLRALQGELFLEAVSDSLEKGAPTQALIELGGEFSELLFSSFVDQDGNCLLDRDALRLMFRTQFNQLTDLSSQQAFKPSLNEVRRYYATLLEHPPAPGNEPVSAARHQLAYARALADADPSFDATALMGMLYLRLDQPGHATKMFDAYLSAHPNGPFSHAVRGHLKFALLRVGALISSNP